MSRRLLQLFVRALCLIAVGGVALLGAEASAGTFFSARGTSGGTAPESGPLISAGTVYSGNTSGDPVGGEVTDRCCLPVENSEWWNINLTNGEEALIKGEDTSVFMALVMPPGTTTLKLRNAASNQTSISELAGGDLSKGVLYKATFTGTYPIVVGNEYYWGQSGPFNFTVTIYHDAFLFGPRTVVGSTKSLNALTVSLRDKEGTAVSDPSVVVTLTGVWRNAPGAAPSAHLLATGHPVNGRVVFQYRLPGGFKGGPSRLVTGASAASYQAIRSISTKLTVSH